jgi:hypothetical protein
MPDYRKDLLRSQYPVRQPYADENNFFRANPGVAGYAADDQAVVLNPHSPLSEDGKSSVALNEAARLHMMNRGTIHNFPLTDQQQQFFANTPYGNNPQMAKHTVVARLLSGDPSAAPYSDAQKMAAESVLSGLLLDR